MFSDLLPRVFIHKENGQEIVLTDPDRNLSPEEVCDSYAALYAILATAKIVGPEFKNDTAEYQFVPEPRNSGITFNLNRNAIHLCTEIP